MSRLFFYPTDTRVKGRVWVGMGITRLDNGRVSGAWIWLKYPAPDQIPGGYTRRVYVGYTSLTGTGMEPGTGGRRRKPKVTRLPPF